MVHRDFVIDSLFYLEVIVFLWNWAEVQKWYKRGKKSFKYYIYIKAWLAKAAFFKFITSQLCSRRYFLSWEHSEKKNDIKIITKWALKIYLQLFKAMVVLWELEFSPKELLGISDNCFKETEEQFTINGSSLQKVACS